MNFRYISRQLLSDKLCSECAVFDTCYNAASEKLSIPGEVNKQKEKDKAKNFTACSDFIYGPNVDYDKPKDKTNINLT